MADDRKSATNRSRRCSPGPQHSPRADWAIPRTRCRENSDLRKTARKRSAPQSGFAPADSSPARQSACTENQPVPTTGDDDPKTPVGPTRRSSSRWSLRSTTFPSLPLSNKLTTKHRSVLTAHPCAALPGYKPASRQLPPLGPPKQLTRRETPLASMLLIG